MPTGNDPYLTLALRGVHLIEASAGTGKTFVLTTMVLRLIVERKLRLRQLLVVTYTDAATNELRRRIRDRCILALRLLNQPHLWHESLSAESTLTVRLLQTHLQHTDETPQSLSTRLQQACAEMDLAAIHTIHGFCARALRECALDSDQIDGSYTLLADPSLVYRQLAEDLWRDFSCDADMAAHIQSLWKRGPDAFSRDLPALLRTSSILPPLVSFPQSPHDRVLASRKAFVDAFRQHETHFKATLIDAIATKTLHNTVYTVAWVEQTWFSILTDLPLNAEDGCSVASLQKLTSASLLQRTKKGRTPVTCPFDREVSSYLMALIEQQKWHTACQLRCLQAIQKSAHTRLARLKRQHRVLTYDDLIDKMLSALTQPHAATLVHTLQSRYAAALVDEFQDTDARQWQIFQRLFATPPTFPGEHNESALFLIGDPKQAIYGFRGGDVETYLKAAENASHAPPLAHNYRSRPVLLDVINQLYCNTAEDPFHQSGIQYQFVQTGGLRQDTDLMRHGAIAPALTVWHAPPPDNDQSKFYRAPESLELCSQACAIAIYHWLKDSQDDQTSIMGRSVQPQDIAVLVRNHEQATRMQRCLMQLGIPATSAGKQRLFQTAEAQDAFTLLTAVLHSNDESWLRAALATELIGLSAASIDALRENNHDWHAQMLKWRMFVLHNGPYALFEDVCAQQATRLLAYVDGERRISNYLQIGEHLQALYPTINTLQGYVAWLQEAMADDCGDDRTQLLRLESDSTCVQIMTFHKSKGLEFPLVFLPFIAIGRQQTYAHPYYIAKQGSSFALYWKTATDQDEWQRAMDVYHRAQQAEEARLLYVGLTRAIHAIWLATGPFYQQGKTAWSVLCSSEITRQDLSTQPASVHDFAQPVLPQSRLSLHRQQPLLSVRQSQRQLQSSWNMYSFTQLSQRAGHDAFLTVENHVDVTQLKPATDQRFRGTRFGVVFHRAMEQSDFSAWSSWKPGQPAPPAAQAHLMSAIQDGGYLDQDIEDALFTLTQLVGNTLTTPLPTGDCLARLPAESCQCEMAFQFSLTAAPAKRVLDVLQIHGILTDHTQLGTENILEGMMTGVIDLVYHTNNQWFILDYKTNELDDYRPAALSNAMRAHRYELQALIYTIALHRWLQFHMGKNYDYARDHGGMYYLFCRGLNPQLYPGQGIHHQHFGIDVITTVEALFAQVS